MEGFLSVQTPLFDRFASAPKVPPVAPSTDTSWPKPFELSAVAYSAGIALTVAGTSIFIRRHKRTVVSNRCRQGLPIALAISATSETSTGVLTHPDDLEEHEKYETTEETRNRILAAWEKERQKKIAPLAASIDQMLSGSENDLKKHHVEPTPGVLKTSPLPPTVICGMGSASGEGPANMVWKRLKEAGQVDPPWLDLASVSEMAAEELTSVLSTCNSCIIFPNLSDDNPASLESALLGTKAILQACPVDVEGTKLSQIILMSRVGAQSDKKFFDFGGFIGTTNPAAWSDLEDELTSTARGRSWANPLETVIIRTGPPHAQPNGVRRVLCCAPDEGVTGHTSPSVAAEAAFQALSFNINSNFDVVEETAPTAIQPEWNQLLIPFAGPEMWRSEVKDAKRAAFFMRVWADEFFAKGKKKFRFGIKTPVQLRHTPSGVLFKFRPLATLNEVTFEDLDEGGLEFIAEAPDSLPPRIRIVRSHYGWKAKLKVNSEKALIDKFAKEWAILENAPMADGSM